MTLKQYPAWIPSVAGKMIRTTIFGFAETSAYAADPDMGRRHGKSPASRIVLWAVAAVMTLACATPSAMSSDVAIVVHYSNPIEELSMTDLRRIFKMERQYWDDGKRIYLIMQESGTAEKAVMMDHVFDMSEKQLKKYWLKMLFKEKIPAIPKSLQSSEAVRRTVSRLPNAIGFINAAFLDDSVKAVKIEGLTPGETGYLVN